MPVISNNVVLSTSTVLAGGGRITNDNPIIGYVNQVTASNISATTAAAGFPASNVANVSTNLRWEGVPASPATEDILTAAVNSVEQLEYLAIAKHNLGTIGATVSVEGSVNLSASPVVWTELVGPAVLAGDAPALFRFTPQALDGIRLRIQPGSAAPSVAVMYAGPLLTLQRRIYVGHTPSNYGWKSKIVNNRSESGNFLGRILLNQFVQNKVSMENVTPEYFRSFLVPFLEASFTDPFFFAWRPETYSDEIAFAWMTGDPTVSNAQANGLMNVEFDLGGIYR